MTVLWIILGIFIYLVIGKVFANVLVRFGVYNKDNHDDEFIILIINVFYPLYISGKIVNLIGNVLTKIMFEKHNNDNVQQTNKDDRKMY
jgi:hypothetical protein